MNRLTRALRLRTLLPWASCLALGLLFLHRPAWAHPGGGSELGFGEGVLHPFSGVDHVLIMFAVGLLASRLIGRVSLVIPLAFLLVTGLSFAQSQVHAATPTLPFALGQAAGSCLIQLIGISLGLAWDRRSRIRAQQAQA